jgi:hypothetical protein
MGQNRIVPSPPLANVWPSGANTASSTERPRPFFVLFVTWQREARFLLGHVPEDDLSVHPVAVT